MNDGTAEYKAGEDGEESSNPCKTQITKKINKNLNSNLTLISILHEPFQNSIANTLIIIKKINNVS